MAIAKINEARLRLIKKRQWTLAWGKDYIPAQWATPREAPSTSTPTILCPLKLGGRPFHLMSQNETWVALLSLYHPLVWDVHEQRVLFPKPIPHFLQGHPKAQGMSFPAFRGTVDVAERMGVLSKHPRCKVHLGDGEVETAWFPYLSDLLVFLKDDEGPYVINLNVKDKETAFRERATCAGKPSRKGDDPGVLNRHALEAAYYEDAGIPTRQVVGRDIDQELRDNLYSLFQFHAEETSIPVPVCQSLWEYFSYQVGKPIRANDLVEQAAVKLILDPDEVKTVLMQGIWQRNVLVDLFRPVLMDRPLRSMREDPVSVYKDWFRRA